MALDRDLNVAVLRALFRKEGRKLTGWEMLSATGVRGLRLAFESGAFESVVLTERDPKAIRVLEANAHRYANFGARATAFDSRQRLGGEFDYVDLDPYGSPLDFLSSAVSSVRPAGVLAVTATDLAVLAGADARSCQRRYGSRPIRGRLGPESGLRILLKSIAMEAEANGRRVRPLLSYVLGHHLRCYVRLLDGRDEPEEPPIGVLSSEGQDGPPLPPGGPYGPMWLGRLMDAALIESLELPEAAACPLELAKVLERFRSEVEADTPFYYEPNEVAKFLALPSPPSPDRLVAVLRAQGFRAGRSHMRESAVKTLAPRAAVESAARGLAGEFRHPRTTASGRTDAPPSESP